uniref:Uncharacterized protein n=1 Tax=Clytia hemisphaerica TaxID=252671 RepID=A0A7M5UKP6_9CNID
ASNQISQIMMKWQITFLLSFLSVFIGNTIQYEGGMILYTNAGRCLCQKRDYCENGRMNFDESDGKPVEHCCHWGNLVSLDCNKHLNFVSNGEPVYETHIPEPKGRSLVIYKSTSDVRTNDKNRKLFLNETGGLTADSGIYFNYNGPSGDRIRVHFCQTTISVYTMKITSPDNFMMTFDFDRLGRFTFDAAAFPAPKEAVYVRELNPNVNLTSNEMAIQFKKGIETINLFIFVKVVVEYIPKAIKLVYDGAVNPLHTLSAVQPHEFLQ